MEIYLIRHTTPDIEKGICYGQSDLDVANTFEEEVIQLATKLPSTFDKVYSSPLKRCAILASRISGDVIYDDRLKEIDFGNWEMKKWDDIPRKESKDWMNDFVNIAPPNGESYIQLQNRVIDFYQELLLTPQKSVALITHAGVMRALISHFNGTLLKDSFSIQLTYGYIFKLDVENK